MQYLWGARAQHRDELIRRDRHTGGGPTLDERLYCLMDYYSPTAMVNTSGNVLERYRFSAFGLRTVMGPDWVEKASSSYEVRFGFHGQFLDTESGYYDYGYRYYSPYLGRWLNRDPIEEEGGVNIYAFVGNDPVNRVDQLGLATCDSKGDQGNADLLYVSLSRSFGHAPYPLNPIKRQIVKKAAKVAKRLLISFAKETVSSVLSVGKLFEHTMVTTRQTVHIQVFGMYRCCCPCDLADDPDGVKWSGWRFDDRGDISDLSKNQDFFKLPDEYEWAFTAIAREKEQAREDIERKCSSDEGCH